MSAPKTRKQTRAAAPEPRPAPPAAAAPTTSTPPQRPVDAAVKAGLDRALARAQAEGAEAAIAALREAVAADGREDLSLAWRIMALANALQQSTPKLALELAEGALALDANTIDALVLVGLLQDRLGERQASARSMQQVVRATTATPEQQLMAANMLVRFGQHRLAHETAKAAYAALSQPLAWTSTALYIAQQVADWRWVRALTQELRAAYADGQDEAVDESPRTHLLWCADEALNLKVVATWSKRHIRAPAQAPAPAPELLLGRRLRVGYLSSDFRDHPTALLINGILRHHDRTKFEVHLLCSGWDDGSAIRRELESHCDHVHALATLSDRDAAALIRAHKIDVLVELNGPTRATRLGILGHRPAPVQIAYLGWPGSVGGRVVDYLVADRYCVPAPAAAQYPERLIYLTPTYQPNDHAALTKPAKPSREAVGLPGGDDWRVLGMFNAINKVHGEVWHAWMQILIAVPNTLLWLLDPGPVARAHLGALAHRYGVDIARVRAAPRLPYAQHLARLQVCDLMLDPWPYGGHTSTTDALYAGVPVVSLEGSNFAGRVSGSLLHAAGLGVLVQPTVQAYVNFTVGLLRKPSELEKLRTFLAEQVPSSPLFDSATRTRQLELAFHDALLAVLARQRLGSGPGDGPSSAMGKAAGPAGPTATT